MCTVYIYKSSTTSSLFFLFSSFLIVLFVCCYLRKRETETTACLSLLFYIKSFAYLFLQNIIIIFTYFIQCYGSDCMFACTLMVYALHSVICLVMGVMKHILHWKVLVQRYKICECCFLWATCCSVDFIAVQSVRRKAELSLAVTFFFFLLFKI